MNIDVYQMQDMTQHDFYQIIKNYIMIVDGSNHYEARDNFPILNEEILSDAISQYLGNFHYNKNFIDAYNQMKFHFAMI